jgi:short-chain fatty acids transporter
LSAAESFIKFYRKILPSPMSIALLLTVFTTFGAVIFLWLKGEPITASARSVFGFWEQGLWVESQLTFAIQMMLMLVLGHILALSKPFEQFSATLVSPIKTGGQAVLVVSIFAMLSGFINWGLSLVFGAILARKTAVHCQKNNIAYNYGLLGACGYLGLLVWHGGFSGSSLIKVAEAGHLESLPGLSILANDLPQSISLSQTVLSSFNLLVFITTLIAICVTAIQLHKKIGLKQVSKVNFISVEPKTENEANKLLSGAEKLDFSSWFSKIFGGIVMLFIVIKYGEPLLRTGNFNFITPNFINLSLLGACLIMHQNLYAFLKALNEAISGAAGILIQFPLYFGVMGVLDKSGLLAQFASFLAMYSPSSLFPLITLFSASVVNFFVPSGGGQWLIQGPIIVSSALQLEVPLEKALLAFAYGDQLTNMLQPFWALPLLGITGLKAKEVLPYTFIFFVVALVIYSFALLV